MAERKRGGDTFFVYGLYDSGDCGACRYVGAASKLSRPLEHEREARTRCNTYRYKWIRKVVAEGRRIEWRVLESCPDWPTTLGAEVRIIQEMRAAGARLTNATDGGQGGLNPSPEVRAKRAAGIRAALATPEAKAKRSANARAAWARPGERERRTCSDETRAKMSAAHRRNIRPARPKAARPKAHSSDVAKRGKRDVALSLWQQPEYRAAHAAGWAAKRLKNPKPIVPKPEPKPKKTADEWKAYYKAYYLAHRDHYLAYRREYVLRKATVSSGA